MPRIKDVAHIGTLQLTDTFPVDRPSTALATHATIQDVKDLITPAVPAASVSVTSETAYGQAAAVGVAATFARGDHTHGTPAAVDISGKENVGVAAGLVGTHESTFAHANIATAYSHSQDVTTNPHSVTAAQVGALVLVPNHIQMDTTPVAVPVGAGVVAWNADENTFDFGFTDSTHQLGETSCYVINDTASDIPDGKLVMAAGTTGNSGKIKVALFDASDLTGAHKLVGMTTAVLTANGGAGTVTTFGKVRGIDTSMWVDGDVLYADAAVPGGLVSAKPVAGLAMPVAFVVHAHANGVLCVRTQTFNENVAINPYLTTHTIPLATTGTAVTLQGTYTSLVDALAGATPTEWGYFYVTSADPDNQGTYQYSWFNYNGVKQASIDWQRLCVQDLSTTTPYLAGSNRERIVRCPQNSSDDNINILHGAKPFTAVRLPEAADLDPVTGQRYEAGTRFKLIGSHNDGYQPLRVYATALGGDPHPDPIFGGGDCFALMPDQTAEFVLQYSQSDLSVNEWIPCGGQVLFGASGFGGHGDGFGNDAELNLDGIFKHRYTLSEAQYRELDANIGHVTVNGDVAFGELYVAVSGVNPATANSLYNQTYVCTIDHGDKDGLCYKLQTDFVNSARVRFTDSDGNNQLILFPAGHRAKTATEALDYVTDGIHRVILETYDQRFVTYQELADWITANPTTDRVFYVDETLSIHTVVQGVDNQALATWQYYVRFSSAGQDGDTIELQIDESVDWVAHYYNIEAWIDGYIPWSKVSKAGATAVDVGAIADAPSDTEQYVRKDAGWAIFDLPAHASTHAGSGADPVAAHQYHGIFSRSIVAPLPSSITTTTFTLATASTPMGYYFNGKQVLVNADVSVIIPAPAGLYFIYFSDDAGALAYSATFPGLDPATSGVIVASVYWNGVDLGLVSDERHGYDRDQAWHSWAHNTVGTRYRSGLDLLTLAGTGVAATMTLGAGEIWDEDIKFTIPASAGFATPNAYRHWYQTGASSYSFLSALTTVPFHRGVNNRPNVVNSTGYVLTEVPSAVNRYVNFFVYATTDLLCPIYIMTETVTNTIAGQGGYTSTANARAVPWPNLSAMGMSPEMRPVYRIVVRADGAVQATIPADDYRSVTSLPMAAGTASTTASAVSFTPSGSIAAATVQTAIEELDAEKASLAGSTSQAFNASTLTLIGTTVTDLPTYGTEFLTGGTWTSTDWVESPAGTFDHNTGNTTALSYSLAAAAATKYQIVYTIAGRTAGSVTVAFGGQSVAAVTATGTFGPTATTTDGLVVTPTSDFDGSITLSIKAITAASTPLLIGSTSASSQRIHIRTPTSASCTFVGYLAGRYNTTGINNTAFGTNACSALTTGSYNTAVGYNALTAVTVGWYNTAGGTFALSSNISGNFNTAYGHGSSNLLTTGAGNTAIGHHAGYSSTTGSNNVFIGNACGRYQADGATALVPNNSVYVGTSARGYNNTDDNSIVIGYAAIGQGPNTVVLGNTSITKTQLRGAVTVPAMVTTQRAISNANGTIAYSDYTVRYTTGASDRTLNLSAAVAGQIFVIKKIDSGAGKVLFSGDTSCTIDGVAGASATWLSVQYSSITIQCVTAGAACVFDII